MGRGLLRFLQIALVAFAGLVVVPVAVNIGTGGQAPGWLAPYVNWLWPAALVCVLLVAVLEFLARRDGRADKPLSSLHPDDPRNTPRALAQISTYIRGRRKGALDERVRLALALDERPETVRQTVHLVQRISGTDIQLSTDQSIADVFDEMDGSLLILGAPGAGKTTLLLDLATALLARADETRIPVVADLADWSRSGTGRLAALGRGDDEPRDFADWLVLSLKRRYQIPTAVGRAWLEADRLILLLDGLDEVRESQRARCVEEINRLQEDRRATRVVVCSREADYEGLSGRLRLQGAVSIRPLTRTQVMHYFDAVSPYFARTVEALRADDELWDLLTTPLMLHIMALAQQESTLPPLPHQMDERVRRGQVFDAYLVEVLARRRHGQAGSAAHVLRALQVLAVGGVRMDAGVRISALELDSADKVVSEPGRHCLVDQLLPILYGICATVIVTALALTGQGLIAVGFGALALLVPILVKIGGFWGPAPPHRPLIFLAFVVTVSAVAAGVMTLAIRLASRVDPGSRVPLAAGALAIGAAILVLWLVVDRSEWRGALIVVGASILVAGAILVFGVAREMLTAWAIGTAGMTLAAAVLVPSLTGAASSPLSSISRAGWFGSVVIYAVAFFGPVLVIGEYRSGSSAAAATGFVIGLLTPVIPAAFLGATLIGPMVCLSMYIAGEPVPWRRSFLAFAADRSILTHAEGEYRFIHLLIRDHLADCDPDRLAAMVDKRRAELVVT